MDNNEAAEAMLDVIITELGSEIEPIDLTLPGNDTRQSRFSRFVLRRSQQRDATIHRGTNHYSRFTTARRLFQAQEIEERLLEADTETAMTISMNTYKPPTHTVSVEQLDKVAPILKARRQREKCTVCQEHVKRGETIRILPCFHYLHDECLVGWYTNGNAVCPVCRNKTFGAF